MSRREEPRGGATARECILVPMVPGDLRVFIEKVVADALEVDPIAVAAISGNSPLDAVSLGEIELDSLDFLVIVVELEHHLRCHIELDLAHPGAERATWSDFLSYVERCARQSERECGE